MAGLLKLYDYGRTANGYDWLKAIALFTMIIDHAGKFFFPEAEAMRAIGRVAFPIFLFLVGYNGRYGFHGYLFLCAILVSVTQWFAMGKFLALNILWSILLWRWVMGKLENHPILQQERLMLWLALMVFYIPSVLLVEYGTVGLMFAILGWQLRQHQTAFPAFILWVLTFSFWFVTQLASFDWPMLLQIAFALEACALFGTLYYFRMENTPSLTTKTIQLPVLILARNTLVIYVLHYAAFAFAAKWLITGA